MLLKMERTKIAMMVFIAVFLAVIHKSNGQSRPAPVSAPAYPAIRPLCLSQFALVNHACSMITYSPVQTPSIPTSPPPVADESPCPPRNGHRHGHHHRHRHSSTTVSHTSVAADECCRWLKEVDTQCVCDVLVRLPPFLAKPGHDYTVIVDDDCSVTYSCPGRVIT